MNDTFRQIIVVFGFIATVCGCTRVTDAGDMEIFSFDTNPDTGFFAIDTNRIDTDPQTDTSISLPFIRVDFPLEDDTEQEHLWVDGSTNVFGLQGNWYVHSDQDVSFVNLTNGGGTACLAGTAQSVDETTSPTPRVGMGFSICNTQLDYEPYQTVMTFGECPIMPDLAERIIGISFSVYGPIIPSIIVRFTDDTRVHNPYIEVSSHSQTDYFFADAIVSEGEEPVDPALVLRFHILTEAPTNGETLTFDFCVGNVQLLFTQ